MRLIRKLPAFSNRVTQHNNLQFTIYSYYIYELTTSNVFPLSSREGDQNAPSLQFVLWAPRPQVSDGSSGNGERGSSQGIAFVQDGDIYYKPKVQSGLICRITTNGNIF